MQYISPTCQFALAVFAFGEPFTGRHLAAFACIWAAVAVYAVEALRRKDDGQRTAAAAAALRAGR